MTDNLGPRSFWARRRKAGIHYFTEDEVSPSLQQDDRDRIYVARCSSKLKFPYSQLNDNGDGPQCAKCLMLMKHFGSRL